MTPFFLLLLTLNLSNNAQAALPPRPTLPPAFCQALNYKPSANVAYQPSIDVNGNAVVPADLNAPLSILPLGISIPLNVKILDFLDINKSEFPFKALDETDINLGTLTVRNNQAFLNDKPLGGGRQEKLAALCPKN